MPTSYTTTPSLAMPDQVIGAPIRHLPWVFCCTKGEVFCGWAKAANNRREVADVAAAKRRHEDTCEGGLIVIGSR